MIGFDIISSSTVLHNTGNHVSNLKLWSNDHGDTYTSKTWPLEQILLQYVYSNLSCSDEFGVQLGYIIVEEN